MTTPIFKPPSLPERSFSLLASSSSVHAIDQGLTLNGGVVQLAGAGGDQINNTASVAINGGTFDMGGTSETINGLSGSAGVITNTSATTASTLTVGSSNGGGTYSGTIQNGNSTLALVKIGTGTLTLSGNNSFTGGLTINNGVVAVSADNNLGGNASTVTLAGGTLSVTASIVGSGSSTPQGNGSFQQTLATGTTGGTINVATNDELQINYYQNNSGVITGSGPLTMTGGGVLALSSTTIAGNYSGNWTVTNGQVEVEEPGRLEPVPSPSPQARN